MMLGIFSDRLVLEWETSFLRLRDLRFFSLTGSKYYHIHCIIYINYIYIYYVYVGVYIYKYMNMNMYTFVNMHIYMDNHGIITMYYNIYIYQ